MKFTPFYTRLVIPSRHKGALDKYFRNEEYPLMKAFCDKQQGMVLSSRNYQFEILWKAHFLEDKLFGVITSGLYWYNQDKKESIAFWPSKFHASIEARWVLNEGLKAFRYDDGTRLLKLLPPGDYTREQIEAAISDYMMNLEKYFKD